MTRRIGRRGLLIGGGAAAASLSIGSLSGGRAAAATTLKAGYPKFASGLQYFAAKDKGFFAAEGITLDDSFSPPPVIIPGLLSGRFEMAMQNMLDIALINAKGGDVKVLFPSATLSEQHPYCQLVVPNGSTVRTAKDLEGKRIAMPVLRSSLDADLMAWLTAGGADPAKVSLVGVGMDGVVPAMQSKQFDAAYVIEPALTIILKQGFGTSIAFPPGAISSGYVATGFIAAGSWIDKNPETARAIVRALDKATDWLTNTPAEIPALMARNTGIDEALAKQMINPGPTKVVKRASLQPFLDAATKFNLLPQRVDGCTLLAKYCPSDC